MISDIPLRSLLGHNQPLPEKGGDRRRADLVSLLDHGYESTLELGQIEEAGVRRLLSLLRNDFFDKIVANQLDFH